MSKSRLSALETFRWSPRISYRSALFILLGVFAFQFSGILFRGEVIYPHNNGLETASTRVATDEWPTNRKFSDESSVFIPELANNLRTDRKGWLATWNPHVQLGRPAYQGGLSRAFLLTNLFSFFTSNPFVLYTSLVLLTVMLTGVFFLLFLRSLGLHPAAAVSAAIGLAFTTPVSYWLCFIMFASGFCWPVCLLWLIRSFIRAPSWPLGFGLTFAVHCLVMTSYPQVIVLFAYIIGAYSVLELWRKDSLLSAKLYLMSGLLASASVGMLLALPGLLDLALTARQSSRLSGVSDEFFLGVLPATQDLRGFASYLITLFDWSWLGNAIHATYPLKFNGISFTPVYGALIWLSFLLSRRRVTIFWQATLLLCLAGTIFPSFYLFAVHHLGFNLSRIQLVGGAMIPGFVLSAYTMDAILSGELRFTARSVAWLLLPFLGEALVARIIWKSGFLYLGSIFLTVAIVIAVGYFIRSRSTLLLLGLALISGCFYGRSLVLSRPLQSIYLGSALIDDLKKQTQPRNRFAVSSPTSSLPPNQEALLGLESVNSYDSLSSRRYQALVSRWSRNGADTYGRNFRFINIENALDDPMFPYSGVGAVVSARPLKSDKLTLFGSAGGISLYQTVVEPVTLLQTSAFHRSSPRDAVLPPPSSIPHFLVTVTDDLSDFRQILVTPTTGETLLFLSQQYHSAWRATADREKAQTLIVNGFYQGVIVPPNTKQVTLTYKPYVLWSWLPQLLLSLGGACFLGYRGWLTIAHRL